MQRAFCLQGDTERWKIAKKTLDNSMPRRYNKRFLLEPPV